MTLRVVHYLNQFFAGLGGETVNDTPLQVKEGAVGPGKALQQALGDDATIVATIFAGDDYFVSNQDKCVEQVREALIKLKPDVLFAGPAFDAGRYGLACALVCKTAREMGIPAVTGMHPDNAGLSAYRQHVVAVATGESPTAMVANLKSMAGLGLKLARKEPLGPADKEGYLPTGVRRLYVHEKIGAERAVDMVLARVLGKPFASEIPVSHYDSVEAPPPLKSIAGATIALITSAGIVPRGNPDQQSSIVPRRLLTYDVSSLDRLTVDSWESVHSGFKGFIYNTVNPNYAVPLPAMREAERQKLIKGIYPRVFTVVGASCPVGDAKRMGAQIAQEMKREGVPAAILCST
jgi:glycine reductase complex component B subunit gamma